MSQSLAVLCLAVFAIGGHNRYDGPVLLVLTGDHGVHLADLPLAGLAVFLVVAVWRS